jgi:hypothetical protein
MYRLLAGMFILLMTVACQQNQEEYTKFYDDGTTRPSVAIVPVIDSTSSELSWSLSEEFTTTINNFISQRNALFCASNEEVDNQLNYTNNPFDGNISWVKNSFSANEFVVFLELIKHDNKVIDAKITKNNSKATNLDMAMRIRIIDLRKETPKIVLQEKIAQNYYIPKNLLNIDYSKITWGSKEFKTSHMNNAHTNFSKDIANRINDYILLSKAR